MALDLNEYAAVLRRAIAPPGKTVSATDQVLADYLVDAFWEAKLDGFLPDYTADEEGLVVPLSDGKPEADRTMVALLVLYAAVSILRTQILNTKTTFRAKSGPVEFEQGTSATMLAEMLKQLKDMKKRLLDQVDEAREITDVQVFDAFSTRLFHPELYHGAIELAG